MSNRSEVLGVPLRYRSVLAVAVGLFAAVTALRFAAGTDPANGITLLYALPIALLVIVWGPRGGVAGAAAGLALFSTWAVAEDARIGAVGYLTRAAALGVVAVLAAVAARPRDRAVTADTRWFEMSNDLLVEASLDGYFTRLSHAWERCFGWTREELMARPFREFIHPEDLESTLAVATALDSGPGEVVNFENRYMAKDGSWRWLLWSARSDEHRKYAVARDITERKQLESERGDMLARVEAMARTDEMTGLPNRRSWEEEVPRAMARAERQGQPLAVAMADLDLFKEFNDAHGHPAGDALLTDAAASWRLALRVTDFIARYGGEEFGLLLPDCHHDELDSLLARFRDSTPSGQTVSVGIAYWDGSESAEDLVGRADAALYEAKDAGRDRVVTFR